MSEDPARELQSFANGCKGSMWQSRDETIRLMEKGAERIKALTAERDALRAKLETARAVLKKLDRRNDSLETFSAAVDEIVSEALDLIDQPEGEA